MSLNIMDNFKYLGKKFLDSREAFDTIEDMKLCKSIPDGFITYCVETDKRYEFKSSNIEDPVFGQWKEYSIDVNVDDLPLDDFVTNQDLTNMIDSVKSDMETAVDNKINALVGGAPEALDTLKEIADAMAEDDAVMEGLMTSVGNKVDKEEGKSLIADSEIERLAGVDNYDDTAVVSEIDALKNALSFLEQDPVCEAPVCGLKINPELIEINVDTIVNLVPSFDKKDGGDLTEVKFFRNGELIQTQSSLDAFSDVINTNATYRIEISFADGIIKNTNLGNPAPDASIKAGMVAAESKVTAVGMSYFGIEGEELQEKLKNNKAFDFNGITMTSSRVIYKYPKAFGQLTSIKDPNNFEYINSYTLTEEQVDGMDYLVYTLIDPVTVTDFKQFFR